MVINISKDASGRIIVFFSYNPQLVLKVRTITSFFLKLLHQKEAQPLLEMATL
jgi:hypothetical protein